MKEFNPPNSYRYEIIEDWHGEGPAIHFVNKRDKALDFVYHGDDVEFVRQSIELMEENFKRH